MITDQQRIDVTREHINAAREVVRRTRDSEANEYLEHLLLSGVICTYRQADPGIATIPLESVSNVYGQAGRPQLSILPMYEADKGRGGQWEFFYDYFLKSPGRTAYGRESNEICLRAERQESLFMLGDLIIHEAGHACLAYKKQQIGRAISPEEEDWEEGRLYAMGARLWHKWGGSDYEDILQKACYQLDKLARRSKSAHMAPLADNESWADAFDQIFGPAPTPVVRQSRLKSFKVFANLEWLERQRGAPLTLEIQTEVYRTAYGRS